MPWPLHVSMASCLHVHYNDVIMSAMVSQITSLAIVYLTVYSRADQRKHQSSASLAFVRGIHRWPVNSPHKGPVTLKMFPFDDAIMDEAQTDRNAPNGSGISSPQQLRITIRFFWRPHCLLLFQFWRKTAINIYQDFEQRLTDDGAWNIEIYIAGTGLCRIKLSQYVCFVFNTGRKIVHGNICIAFYVPKVFFTYKEQLRVWHDKVNISIFFWGM